MGAKLRLFLLLFLSLVYTQADLLYKVSSPSYPVKGYGARSVVWDTNLQATLAGYKTRFIDSYSTGLIHDTSMSRNVWAVTHNVQVISGSVSEGTGYGLLMFVWGNEPVSFNALFNSAKAKQQKDNGLFSWINDVNGLVIDTGAATDADEDIALALVFAESLRKSGFGGWSSSTLNYGLEAKRIINALYNIEVANPAGYLLPDDAYTQDFNPSYFSPATYKVFAQFDNSPTHNWKRVIDTNYNLLLLNPGAGKGLAPDWCSFSGTTSNVGRTSGPKGKGMDFWYDAIRVPYRLALDSLWYNESRASIFLDKSMSWIDPANAALYQLDGTLYPTSNDSWHNEMAIGMWGAGARGSSSSLGNNITKRDAFLLTEMSAFITKDASATLFFGTIWYTQAKNEYYNQSLAWLGTAVMNGAAVDVYGDLSSPPSLNALVATFNVASLNNLQIIVSDNDGWNNIKTVTVSITDIASHTLTYIYSNDYGQYNFGLLNSALLQSSSTSSVGSLQTLTLNMQLQILLTNNFLPGAIRISVNAEDVQHNAVSFGVNRYYYNKQPSVNFLMSSRKDVFPTINSVQDVVSVNYTHFDDDDRQNSLVWDFGAGKLATKNNTADFAYIYPALVTGSKVITLTVTDFFGLQRIVTTAVWVNPIPIAVLTKSKVTANINQLITFDSSSSYDDMAISLNRFDVDLANAAIYLQTSNTVTYSYSSAGTKDVMLWVLDNYYAQSNTVTSSVYINFNPSPNYVFSPLTANINQAISLDASLSWDDDHTTISIYEWYSPDTVTSHYGITNNFSFVTPGYHTIVLKVTDNWGAAGIITKAVYVNYPPTASFTYNTSNIYVPCTITFNANLSGDYDDRIASYSWNFGDGITLSTAQSTVVHTYSLPDTRNVSLLVADSFGATHSVSLDIKLYSTIRINISYYDTIGHAIDSAVSGDVISINTLRYLLNDYSENLIITKSIKIFNETPSFNYIKIKGSANGQNVIYISGNINVEMSGLELFNALSDRGGALYINKAYSQVHNSVISSSTANYGGGIYVENATLIIDNVTLNNNSVVNNGGSIYAYQAYVQASGLAFIANQTISGNGGALYLDNSTLLMEASILSANRSQASAGAIYADNSEVFLYKTQFIRNSAQNSKAGAVNVSGGSITASYLLLDGNYANNKGGAFVLSNARAVFKSNLLINNQSIDSGGAIYVNKTSFFETNDTLVGNASSALGKSIYAENQATLNIQNTLAFNNILNDIYAGDDINFISMNYSLAYSFVAPAGKCNTTNLVVGVNPIVDSSYSLSVYSPLIDFGDSTLISGVITRDYNGTNRIKNKAVDIGCFETTDNIAPQVPIWDNVANQVTISTRVTLNASCSTDVYNISASGALAVSINHNLYATQFILYADLFALSRNNIQVIATDRAGNTSNILSLTITQDALPIPSLNVSYATSNYALIATFNARNSLPGAATNDSNATINLYTLDFDNAYTTSNQTGLFVLQVADLYCRWVKLTIRDNYSLTNSLTQNLTPPTYMIPGTLNMISFPMVFSGNISAVLQTTNAKVWYYNVATSPTYNALGLSADFERGKGYWLYMPNPRTLADVTRSYLAEEQIVTVALKQGWNLIGNPYTRNLDYNKVSFVDGSNTYTKSQAFSNGIIFNARLWSYDKADLSSAYWPYTITDNLKIWHAYWLYTAKDVLMIYSGANNMSAFSGTSLIKKDLYTLEISADNYKNLLILGETNKVNNFFDSKVDMMQPPKYINQRAHAYIEASNMSLLSYYQSLDNDKWKIVLLNPAGSTMDIKINQMTARGYRLLDVDNNLLNTSNIILTSAGSYTYYLQASQVLMVVATTEIKVYPNPFNPSNSGKAIFQYSIAGSNQAVSLKIFNIGGQKIYEQNYSQNEPQGQIGADREIYWNGQDNFGKLMGSGMYFYAFFLNNQVAKKGKLILWN